VVAPGLNKTTIEGAAVTSLATHFGVAEDQLTATAVESRRLGMDDNSRRLPGTWSITYEVQVSPTQLASVNEKVTAAANNPDTFKSELTTKFKDALTAAGVDASSVTISAVTTPGVTTPGVTTTKNDVASAAAGKSVAFISLVTVTKLLFSRT